MDLGAPTIARPAPAHPVRQISAPRPARPLFRRSVRLRRRRGTGCIDACSEDGLQTDEGWFAAHKKRKDWTIGPDLGLTREQAVEMQLQVNGR